MIEKPRRTKRRSTFVCIMYRLPLGDPLTVVLLLRTDGGTYNIQNIFFNVAGIRLLKIAINYKALRQSFRRTEMFAK